ARGVLVNTKDHAHWRAPGTQEADVQRKSICGLDEYSTAEGKRLHGLWKTGGLTEPPNIEELLRKEQTSVGNAFKARAKATAAPPRAQIAAKREVESRDKEVQDVGFLLGGARYRQLTFPREAAARGELEADLSQMSGADGIGPDLDEEAGAADFLGATPS
ncbi:unnamed protein product, partial [Prorocentrum cordatum]